MSAPGDVIDGRYVVCGLLGRGGMAEVYRATDTASDETVAVKVLHDVEPSNVRRFGSEVDVLARLDHPGLVRLRGSGTHEGVPYLVLDLARGPSLSDMLARGPLGTDRTAAVGAQLADALAHAHRLDIVHRDVKPSNVLFDEAGRARLADFGIARLGTAATLTRTGQVVGSAPYLAPEQVAGQPIGPAADVYSLGLVLIECLTGRPCYQGGYAEAAIGRLHRAPAVPADAPTWLRDVLTAMTATDPGRRPSAAAVADSLRRQTAEPVPAATAAYDRTAVAGLAAVAPPEPRRHDTAPLPVGTSPRPQPFQLTPARRLRVVVGGAVVAVVVAAVLAWGAAQRSPADEPPATSTTSAPPATTAPPPSEPDGKGDRDDQGNGNGRGNGRSNGNDRGDDDD